MPNRERKSWKAWAVVDRRGNYEAVVRRTRIAARSKCRAVKWVNDGKFVVVPIRCTEITVDEKKRRKVKRATR